MQNLLRPQKLEVAAKPAPVSSSASPEIPPKKTASWDVLSQKYTTAAPSRRAKKQPTSWKLPVASKIPSQLAQPQQAYYLYWPNMTLSILSIWVLWWIGNTFSPAAVKDYPVQSSFLLILILFLLGAWGIASTLTRRGWLAFRLSLGATVILWLRLQHVISLPIAVSLILLLILLELSRPVLAIILPWLKNKQNTMSRRQFPTSTPNHTSDTF